MLKDASVLIVGADSMIGQGLISSYRSSKVPIWTTTRHHHKVTQQNLFLNLSEDVKLWKLPQAKIDTAILCAATTSIEKCRFEPKVSQRVNVTNTVALAQRLVEAGMFVVFISTNMVFDGRASFAKTSDATNPQTEYGKQKEKAENSLLKMDSNIAIVRFSKIIGPKMPLLHQWVLDLQDGKSICPFYDMIMAPISLRFAVAVLQAVSKQRSSGVFHASANRDVSYAQIAKSIAHTLNVDDSLVQPVSCQNAKVTHAPFHTALNCDSLVQLGLCSPPPEQALNQWWQMQS